MAWHHTPSAIPHVFIAFTTLSLNVYDVERLVGEFVENECRAGLRRVCCRSEMTDEWRYVSRISFFFWRKSTTSLIRSRVETSH